MQDSYLWVCVWTGAWRGLMTGFCFWSWSLQLRNDTKMSPQLKRFFFFIVVSVVYGWRSLRAQDLAYAGFSRLILGQVSPHEKVLKTSDLLAWTVSEVRFSEGLLYSLGFFIAKIVHRIVIRIQTVQSFKMYITLSGKLLSGISGTYYRLFRSIE
jgi:hypothetical protein